MGRKATGRLFSNSKSRLKLLRDHLGDKLSGKPFAVVWIEGNAPPGTGFTFPARTTFTRVLLIFEGRPVNYVVHQKWRNWAQQRQVLELKVEMCEKGMRDSDVKGRLMEVCAPWFAPSPQREEPAVQRGAWVSVPKTVGHKDDPAVVTMTFGRMGEALTRMDWVRHRFDCACGVTTEDRVAYQRQVAKCLAERNRTRQDKIQHPELAVSRDHDDVPRLLLFGETGVGKTLFTKYLAQRSVFVRISIPEYLMKEDMLEYDLFGYAAGAYTGGKEEGHLGLLIENVGGVVFLDEIGEASPAVQAKLLAYLDDYCVRPRGWSGKPFLCPTFVVAATNQDLQILVKEKRFREDLLRRFTDHETLPPLRERQESLPFILDCLLQRPAINPAAAVTEIGSNALRALQAHRYKGNFRDLENVLRRACTSAKKDGRSYLTRADISF